MKILSRTQTMTVLNRAVDLWYNSMYFLIEYEYVMRKKNCKQKIKD